ncbi:MAG: hypothetical protein KGI50_04725 [Patescibacteria group bacterium]|nr:hypothetical protein [Patescibacteria group bacterium]MDE2438658.1 hypothetical protein [Patescibacteria group bacterium]
MRETPQLSSLQSHSGDTNLDEATKSTLESLKKDRVLLSHFFKGLETGSFVPLSTQEIQHLVETIHLGFEPLIPLPEQEKTLLKEYLVHHLSYALNRETYQQLCGVIYRIQDPLFPERSTLVVTNPEEQSGGLIPLSLREKVKFLDPTLWNQTHLKKGNSTKVGLSGYGQRHLKDYGFPDYAWKNLLDETRNATKRETLTVLDVGCGVGMALDDMKRIDSSTETHGLTVDQEPSMFPVDFYHYAAAEYVPQDFKERFDIIVSNMSFRYHLFPHISLQNMVLSLSVGGTAQLAISYDNGPYGEPFTSYFTDKFPGINPHYAHYEASAICVKQEFGKINTLVEQGKLLLVVSASFYEHGCQGYIEIKKLQPITQEEL